MRLEDLWREWVCLRCGRERSDDLVVFKRRIDVSVTHRECIYLCADHYGQINDVILDVRQLFAPR